MNKTIKIKGARVNNLKNISLEIPRNKLIVITGLSGSGKSSLAFDTIYAEGQRRYVESLSSYARQFLDVQDKPDVDLIAGLSPAIAIDQRSSSRNPRSTVGTITETYDLLRLLYARIGIPHCPVCGRELKKQSVDEIVDKIWAIDHHVNVTILAPVLREQKGSHRKIFEELQKANYYQVRFDGIIYNIEEALAMPIDKQKKHTMEVVVDRVLLDGDRDLKNQLSESVKIALDLGDGLVVIQRSDTEEDQLFSQYYNCPECGVNFPEIDLRSFSFNSPNGACTDCSGLGTKQEVDPQLVISNPRLTLAEGAIKPWTKIFSTQTSNMQLLEAVAQKYKFSLNTPAGKLSKKAVEIVLYGTGPELYHIGSKSMAFIGVIPFLEQKYKTTDSDYIRKEIEKYMRMHICPTCGGKRLKKESLAVTVAGINISEFSNFNIGKIIQLIAEASLSVKVAGKKLPRKFDLIKEPLDRRQLGIADQIFKELKRRLGFIEDVGLGYLTLDRSAVTLSGGEAQRIRLATQMGSKLAEVVYVLDEPTIGLHQADVTKLIGALQSLKAQENTVIVVEHDESTMLAADQIIDIGPGAGIYGGEVIAQGTPEQIKKNPKSLTGQYLSGKKKICATVSNRAKRGNGKNISIKGATANNLKNINVEIPLGKFVCITGVSGSGKSTLMTDILSKALARQFYRSKELPAEHKSIDGIQHLDKVITIDQSPIGRTPRSNPATYTGVFTYIRDLFTQIPEAKIKGYDAGKFSFNVKGGRCEACGGDGFVKIEMQFLPDVYVICEECKGTRYKKEILEIHYRGKNIADILEMTIAEANEFFSDIPILKEKLTVLQEVGLGYLKLGQSATTLSGGEAQRIKLATELSRYSTGKTLYILDEPTTGLHFDDINRLLLILNRLVDKGNSVLIIEHNVDVIRQADWIIDLGPAGGENGGYLVAQGAPADIIRSKKSLTGKYLKKS
ncbi:MAG: excinuclease ABC subunit UvrA [Patescibacteria group bacterium]